MDFHTIRTGHSQMEPALFDSITRLFDRFPDHLEGRLLDPFAGNGEALSALAQGWGMEPYAIEHKATYWDALRDRFDVSHVIHESVSEALITPRSFAAAYCYPPFSNDVPLYELNMLRTAHNWVQRGGYMLNVIFQKKLVLSRELLAWMWRTSENVDIFRLGNPSDRQDNDDLELYLLVCRLGGHPRLMDQLAPTLFKPFFREWWWNQKNPPTTRQMPILDQDGALIGTYDSIETRLRTTKDADDNPVSIHALDADHEVFGPSRLADAMIEYIQSGNAPHIDTISGPLYAWPESVFVPRRGRISFRPRNVSEDLMFELAQSEGVHLSAQHLFAPQGEPEKLRPIFTSRNGQAGIVIASGALGDNVKIGGETPMIIRARTEHHSKQTNVRRIIDEHSRETRKVVETWKDIPLTTITTLSADGTIATIQDDAALEAFVAEHGEALMDYMRREFPPIYSMEDDERYAYFKPFLDMVKVRGQDDLAPNQYHVISGYLAAFMEMKGAILVGEWGSGKTVISVALAHLMRSIAYDYRYSTRRMRKDGVHKAVIMPGEVVVVLVPPTVATDENWLGEFELSVPNCAVFLASSFDDVKACEQACDESKAALGRIRAKASEGSTGTDEDWQAASRLNVLVLPESLAKEHEGWSPAVLWKQKHNIVRRHLDPGTPGRVGTELLPHDPTYEMPITEYKNGQSRMVDPDVFMASADGTGSGERRTYLPGRANRKYEPYPGDPIRLEEAFQDYLNKRVTYEERIRSGWYREPPTEQSQTHIEVRREYPMIDPETGEPVTNPWGGVRHRSQIDYRHPVSQAMMKIRVDRKHHDEEQMGAVPLWQQARTTSSLRRLVGADPRQRLTEIASEAIAEDWRERFVARYPHINPDSYRRNWSIMPLPDICEKHLRPEECLVGEQENWTNGRAVSLADYILRKFDGRIALFVADELHQYKNFESQRAVIMTRFANKSRHTLGLTATLFGGVANTIFLLLYIFNKAMRRDYPDLSAQTINRFQQEMGVIEYTRTTTYLTPDGNPAQNVRPVESRPRPAPGAAPALLTLTLPCTGYFNKRDMGVPLPAFTQIPVPIPMDGEERLLYGAIEDTLTAYKDECRNSGDYTFNMASFQALSGLTSAFWREREVWHHTTWIKDKWAEYLERVRLRENELDPLQHWTRDVQDKKTPKNRVKVKKLVTTIPAMGEDRISSKERWLVRAVNGELAEGRFIAVYVAQSDKHDIRKRLSDLIKLHCTEARPFALESKIKTKDRSAYINARAAQGMNVMITNAKLVDVGINMLDYPTIIFYESHPSLYVMSQASGRAHRMNQTQACRVYYPYNVKTLDEEELKLLTPVMEQAVINLIAKKEAAAAFMRGDRATGLSELASEDGEDDVQKYVTRMLENDNSGPFIDNSSELFASASFGDDQPPTYMEDHIVATFALPQPVATEPPSDEGEVEINESEEVQMPLEDLTEGLLGDEQPEITVLNPARAEIEHLLPDEAMRRLYYEVFDDPDDPERIAQLRDAVSDFSVDEIVRFLVEVAPVQQQEPAQATVGELLPSELFADDAVINSIVDAEVEVPGSQASFSVEEDSDRSQEEAIVAELVEQMARQPDGPRLVALIGTKVVRFIRPVDGAACQIDIPQGTILMIDEEFEEETTLMDAEHFIIWATPDEYEALSADIPVLEDELPDLMQWMTVVPEIPEVRVRFDYRALWEGFISSFPRHNQNRVKQIFNEPVNYGDVRLNRRQFVELSAAAVMPVDSENRRLGDFTVGAGETAYASFIYRHLPEYQQIICGEAKAVTPFPEGLSHSQILSWRRQ